MSTANAMILFPRIVEAFVAGCPYHLRPQNKDLPANIFDVVTSHPLPGRYAAILVCGMGRETEALARTTSEHGSSVEALQGLLDILANGVASRLEGADARVIVQDVDRTNWRA